jgi:hypothetical protein
MIGKNENVQAWENNIFNAVKDVSDIDLQKSTWLGKHPEYISSFTEVIASLYDDFDFERYLNYYKSTNGNNALYKLLYELNNMIEKYKASGYEIELKPKGLEMILSDPQWIEITKKAKEVCKSVSSSQGSSGIK